MRIAPWFGLIVLSGCQSIAGIEEPKLRDAAVADGGPGTPSITSFTPTTTPVNVSFTLDVMGSHFTGASQVVIVEVISSTSFLRLPTVLDDSHLRATFLPTLPGAYTVRVTSPAGTGTSASMLQVVMPDAGLPIDAGQSD